MNRLLHVFPESGFDKSATTPVLLGVLVSWLFTETFGWVFAGLVVPGYLAALFLLDPRVATVDLLEVVATYGLARLLGEHLARTGLTSRMFGRERFFLIVLVSIVVRLAVEGVMFPRLASHATWAFSIGLVVVPLTANACWKTGLWRGALQTGLPTVVVYVLLRYVLLPHTNLSLAGFNLATENISTSFLASPKAYILLLTGAILAAFANLRYGWDYNGILIPALLTLVVTHPLKLAATVAEVMILLGVVQLLVRLPPLRSANIEGPRRPVLFFTIDYGLRFAFAAIVGRSLPSADVVDLMGFGYLLPTLLAVKVSQKGLASLVVLPAMAVSIVAFGVGTLVGFAAAAVDRAPATARKPVIRAVPRAPGAPSSAALWVSALARPTAATGALANATSPSKLASIVDALLAEPSTALPPDLEMQRLERDVLLVRERFEDLQDRLGEPAVLAAPKTSAGRGRLVVVVPGPLRCPECAALAGRLLETRAVDAVVVAGVEESDESGVGAAATGAVARSLAGSEEGLVASLRRASADVGRVRVVARVRADARTAPFLHALDGAVGELRDEASAPDAPEEIAIELPAARADRWLSTPSSPSSSPLPLESATDIAAALDGVRRSTTPVTLEERLALRRLVLEPLLDASPSAQPSSVVRASATMLGYTLRGPSKLADGSEAMALLPGASPRPIALVARTRGVRGAVVEIPHGAHEGLRALGVELAVAVHADAIILGLESDGRLFGDETLRDAHGAATWPQPGREARVVLLREAALEADEDGATIGAWPMVGTDALLASVESALRDDGVRSTRTPLDLAAREEAGRSFFGNTRLVAVAAGPRALRKGALETTLVAARELASLPRFDAPCADVAQRLAAGLPKDGAAAPDALLDIAQRAVVERSIVARRALDEAIAATASRAALSRTAHGTHVVVVGRTAARVLLVAAIPVLASSAEASPPHRVPSLEACLPELASGGQCRVESR
jgi:hypothetical protein